MLSQLLLTLSLTTIVSAISGKNNVALYWGQNSEGSQTNLASYCQSEDADIYMLSFLDMFGSSYSPQVNFANQCSDTYSDGTLHCSKIGEDIKTCQSLGKTILLSLGGASGAYGFTDDSDAEDFALTLWNMFGAGSNSSINRPFDDAVVDGFDFDIENNDPTGYAALATKLRSYFSSDTSKSYYLSAAPQCPYPDASVGNLLANADIDFAFIQFYNNYCSTVGSNFNWDTWAEFAQETSPNKDIKLFLGLPAASGAAGSGYATIDEIKNTFDTSIFNNEDSNFGGFVLWDASWSSTNTNDGETFGNQLQSMLDAAYSTGDSSSSTSSAQTTETTGLSTSVESTTSTQSTEISSSTSSTSTSSVETTPTSTTSVETTPVETTPVETTPVETTPVETTPAGTTPVETTPVETTPAGTTLTQSSFSAAATSVTVPGDNTLLTLTTSSILSPSASNIDKNSNATPSSSSSVDSASSTDCSTLTGLEKAQCMNTNFKAGLYLATSGTCTEGAVACDASGAFAICNFGNWVSMQCGAGTTCYAYNFGDEVDVGCDYINSESKFEKRSEEGLFALFKRQFVYSG